MIEQHLVFTIEDQETGSGLPKGLKTSPAPPGFTIQSAEVKEDRNGRLILTTVYERLPGPPVVQPDAQQAALAMRDKIAAWLERISRQYTERSIGLALRQASVHILEMQP